ncbi:MAG TPA: 3-oxoacyl-[acyl-carrier-protein] synthase III C-terminal domain-containing protein [Verrucomicrobiales bacterium]|nr:3-oxoacyl-[acyl-carrier-protein] synthase III C-terminal domain-containing protein [Verrucomicrobiales bacterium]
MYLHSISPAWPDNCVTQSEALALLKLPAVWDGLRPRSRSILEKVLSGDSGIDRRYAWSRDTAQLLAAAPHDLAALFEKAAPALAAEALSSAMDSSNVRAEEVDALFICTCTGYLCPGVTSHVAEVLNLRPDAVLHDVVGLGCGAAIPTLRTASEFLTANPGATAAVIAVEICSAAFYVDDDPGVLISLCLFGDGACATLWRGRKENAATGWRASGFRSLHQPEYRERIRFVNAGGRLRNQLHRSVPGLAAAAVKQLYDADAAAMKANTRIIAHSGGRDVLDALRAALPGHPLEEAEAVLRDCGNMSSPSVLIALHRALTSGVTDPLWLTAFGAGFSAHSCRLDLE